MACARYQHSMLYVPHTAFHAKQKLNSPQIVVYAVVIFAFWNIPGARVLINPLKLFTIGWHELCHITAVRAQAPLTAHIPELTIPTGNTNGRHSCTSVHRPRPWRGDASRRRSADAYPHGRLCRVHHVRRCIDSSRIRHAGRQDYELHHCDWFAMPTRTSTGQIVSTVCGTT